MPAYIKNIAIENANGERVNHEVALNHKLAIGGYIFDGTVDVNVPQSAIGGDGEMELTMAEYQALSYEDKMNGTTYYITDINVEGNLPVIVLTKEQYDALGDEKYSDDKLYLISDDVGDWTATGVGYDNSKSGLAATNVGDALDEINNILKNNDIAIPLLLENWIENEDGTFSQDIAIEGISAAAAPGIMLSSVGDVATEEENFSYACISDVITSENNIKFIASEKPSMSFTVIAKGVNATGDAVATVTNLVNKVNELETNITELNSKLGTEVDLIGWCNTTSQTTFEVASLSQFRAIRVSTEYKEGGRYSITDIPINKFVDGCIIQGSLVFIGFTKILWATAKYVDDTHISIESGNTDDNYGFRVYGVY